MNKNEKFRIVSDAYPGWVVSGIAKRVSHENETQG